MFREAQRRGLMRQKIPEDVYRWGVIQSLSPVVFFLISVPLAFVSTALAVVVWFGGIPFTVRLQSLEAGGRGPLSGALAEVRHQEEQDQRGRRDDHPDHLAGDPTDGANGPVEILGIEEVQQTVRHGLPLFLAPAGLAVGLALKEVRYGTRFRFAPGSVRTPWFPRSLRAAERLGRFSLGGKLLRRPDGCAG